MLSRIKNLLIDFRTNFLQWKSWSIAAGVKKVGLPIFRWKDAIYCAIQSGEDVLCFGAPVHPRTASFVRARLDAEINSEGVVEDLSRKAYHWEPYSSFRFKCEQPLSQFRLLRRARTKIFEIPKKKLQKGSLIAATLTQENVVELKSWLSHYRKLGVDHFLVGYNGQIPADWSEFLTGKTDVTVVEWALPYGRVGEGWNKKSKHYAQPPFVQWAYKWAGLMGYEWVLTCDLDEFVVADKIHIDRLKETTHNEVVFENVWACVPGDIDNPMKSESIMLAEQVSSFVHRGKSMKRAGVYARVGIHYTDSKGQFGGWFLHFAFQTGGSAFDRLETSFEWRSPVGFDMLEEELGLLNLPLKNGFDDVSS